MEDNIFFKMALFLAGAFLFGCAVAFVLRAHAWPQTQGRVTASFVHSHGLFYGTVIEYEYFVGRKRYVSKRLRSIWPPFHLELIPEIANRIVAKYPVGSGVEVYYDPESPKNGSLNLFFGRATLEDLLTWGVMLGAIVLTFLAYAPGVGSGGKWHGGGSRTGATLVGRDFEQSLKSKK